MEVCDFVYQFARPREIRSMSDIKKTIHPTLHHYGLTTSNLKRMAEWYATALRMSVVSFVVNICADVRVLTLARFSTVRRRAKSLCFESPFYPLYRLISGIRLLFDFSSES